MNDQVHIVRKWWASALMIGAVVGLASLLVGALGTKTGIWGFEGGFMLLAVGTVLAAVVFFLGVIAYVYSWTKKLPAERGAVLVGLIISVAILGLMFSQFRAATSVPSIHNISTDTENPPQFDKIIPLREAQGANPLQYDTATLADAQRKAYPQVQPLISNQSAQEMIARAANVMQGMGLEVVDINPAAGRVEATDTTFWFGFKDDVVVRVRSEGAGSVVDVRSVSRVGQSDLGENAERIREILAGLRGD